MNREHCMLGEWENEVLTKCQEGESKLTSRNKENQELRQLFNELEITAAIDAVVRTRNEDDI